MATSQKISWIHFWRKTKLVAVGLRLEIISVLWSSSHEDPSNIGRNIYPFIPNNEAAICVIFIRDLLYMKHFNKYFPDNSLFNNEEIDFMMHVLGTQ